MTTRVFLYEYLSGGGRADVAAAEIAADDRAILLPQGLAMRDALLDDLLQVAGVEVGVACADDAAGVAPPARTLRPLPGESAVGFADRAAGQHDVAWVVAPETGGLLAAFERRIGPGRWLGCDAETIRLTTRKRATLLHLSRQGVPTPLDFSHAAEIRHWVVKPDDGAGAVATQRHADADAAWEDWACRSRDAAMAIEPWVEGEPLSLSLLCRGDGVAELLSINRQCIRIDADGFVVYDGVEIHIAPPPAVRREALAELAGRVARALPGLRGFAGIDFVWHPRRGAVLIEVNPRVTCAYVGLSRALGRNLAADLLAAHAARGHGRR